METQDRKSSLRTKRTKAILLTKLCSFIVKADGAYSHLYIGILTYFIEQSPSVKIAGSQLVRKCPEFYGTRKFITALTSKCPPPVPVLSQIKQIHAPHPSS
jgi:hypothetical protein